EARRELGRVGRNNRQARRPRVSEATGSGRGAGTDGLVAVERRQLAHHRTRADSRDGDESLEDLCEVVICRVLFERSNHRIVAAERNETATGEERRVDGAPRPLRAEHELVQVDVWMPAVDET